MDASKGKDAQREAIEKMQRLYPSYFGNLTTEDIKTGKLTAKYKELRGAIIAAAQARAIDQEIEKLAGEDLKERMGNYEKMNQINAQIRGYKRTNDIVGAESAGSQIAELEQQAKDLKKSHLQGITNRNKKMNALLEMKGNLTPQNQIVESNRGMENPEGSNGKASTGTSKTNRPAPDNSIKESQQAYENALKQRENIDKEYLEAFRKIEDERFKIIQESEEKEKKQRETQHRRAIEDLEIENEEIVKTIEQNNKEISKLETQKGKTKSPEAQSNYQKAINELKQANEEKARLIWENIQLGTQMERTYQSEINKITEKYRLERYQKFQEEKQKEIEEKSRIAEEEIQQITSFDDAKAKLSEMKYLKLTDEELKQIKTLEDAKKALRENANREILQEQLAAIQEQKTQLESLLNDESFSPEAREMLKKDLYEVNNVITRIKGTIQGNVENDDANQESENKKKKDNMDILGFSATQWEDMFKNLNSTEGKIKGIIMATQALSNAFRMFSQLQQNLNERELRKFTQNQDKKKHALLKQLNQGLITQEQYHKGIQALEDETAEKKRQIQRRAAKAEKATNLMSSIAGTASAVVGALGMKPWTPANIVLAGIIGALGAVQVATIAATPIPEFAEGGFTGKGSGKPDRTGFRPAGIVHENEYVTPKWMLENPVVADVVGWMESIRTGRTNLPKGYAEGGLASMKNEDLATNKDLVNSQVSTISDPQLTVVLAEVRDLLSDLKENGVDAFMIEDAENGKRIKRTIKMFEKLEQKNARK